MPWNILILPLLAGYYMLSYFELTRFSTERLDRQRLVFKSSIYALIILILTFFIRFIVEQIFPCLVPFLYKYLPYKTLYLGTSLASFGLTVVFVWICNIFISKDKQADRVLKKYGNTFEQMMRVSFKDAKPIQFTLDSGKTYIAFVKETFKVGSNYIRVIPIMSGYRDSKTMELILTTDYFKVFEKYIENDKASEIGEVDLIITLDNVVSVSYFDSELYNEFNPHKPIK